MDVFTGQEFKVDDGAGNLVDPFLTILDGKGNPVQVPASDITWASSDSTVISVVPSADGLSAAIKTVGPSLGDGAGGFLPARISGSVDADPSTGVRAINFVSEDIFVAQNPNTQAQTVVLNIGAAQDIP